MAQSDCCTPHFKPIGHHETLGVYVMFRHAVFVLCALSTPVAAETWQEEAAMRRHVGFLASDEMKGREAGTPEYDSYFWPRSKKGFFPFKEQIPKVLAQFGMT